MLLCKVTGSVVATLKHERFRSSKLLLVHRIDTDGTVTGEKDLVALDPGFDAGIGDIVLVAREGAAVAQVLGRDDAPANVIILGVVDDWVMTPEDTP